MAASTALVAIALSGLSHATGVPMGVDEYTQSFFVALFMYGVGLGIGPSLHHGLRGDGLKLAGLAALSSILGLALTVAFVRAWDLPPGAAGGILAGAMTAPSALGPAQEALRHGGLVVPHSVRHDEVAGMIGLSYALTSLWGALGILLACKYLPSWWGIDLRAEARKHEEQLGVANLDEAGLSGYQPLSIRAYRVTNDALTGWTVKRFGQEYPHYSVLNVLRPEPARRAAVEASGRAFAGEKPVLVGSSPSFATRTPRCRRLRPRPSGACSHRRNMQSSAPPATSPFARATSSRSAPRSASCRAIPRSSGRKSPTPLRSTCRLPPRRSS
jgi:hypothetical protein